MADKSLKKKLVAHGHKMDSTGDSDPLVGEFAEFLQVEVREDTAVRLSPDRSVDAEAIAITAGDDDVVELTLEDNLQAVHVHGTIAKGDYPAGSAAQWRD